LRPSIGLLPSGYRAWRASDAVVSAEHVSQPTRVRLLLAEQLMLLAFRDSDGRLVPGARFCLRFGLPGAILAELALCYCVVIEESRSLAGKRRVLALPRRTGDPLLDTVAACIQSAEPRNLAWWIKNGSRSGLHGQVLGRLSAAGLVTTAHGTFRRRSRLVSPAARADAAARVEQALLADPVQAAALWTADPRSASLTSLAFACRLLQVRSLPRGQRRTAKASLAVIRRTDPIGLAVATLVNQASRSPT
jgi:hypothetical protein